VDTGPTGSSRRRRAIVAVAIAALIIDTVLQGLIAPLLPEIEHRTGAAASALGAAFAAYAAPILLFSLSLGRAADAIGRRALLVAGLLLITVGSALIAITDSLAVLITGRAVQGIGSAASWIGALALVSDVAPPGRRGETIGFAFAAIGFGSIAGPALGGVTAELISFAAPFLIVSVASLALVAAVFAVLPRETRRPAPETATWSTVVRSTTTGTGPLAAAIIFAGSGMLGLIEVVAPLDLDARLGLSSAGIGLLFAGSIVVDSTLSPIGGRWGDRRGRRRPATAGLAMLALSSALLAVLPGVAGAALALGALGAGFGLSFAAAVPWLDEAFGDMDRGLAYGVLNVLYAAGYVVGPLAGGWMLELASADLAYELTAAVLAGGTLVLLVRTRASTTTAPSA
jgi:MFS family permease